MCDFCESTNVNPKAIRAEIKEGLILQSEANMEGIEGLCCDCKHDNRGFCGDYSENKYCSYKKEDGSCWSKDCNKNRLEDN